MHIVIKGAKQTPLWEQLEDMVKHIKNQPEGRFTKIHRTDNNVNYHAPGRYEVDFTYPNGVRVPIIVEVSESL